MGEIDTFAQKGIDCYRGFGQVYTWGLVRRELLDDNKKKVVKMEEGDLLLAEMLISLPKVRLWAEVWVLLQSLL